MKGYLSIVFVALALVFFTLPAMAEVEEPVTESCDFDVFISEIGEFSIECFINDIVIDDCDDFLPAYNIGYISYSVCANVPWELSGYWVNVQDEDESELPFPPTWTLFYSMPSDGGAMEVFTEEEDGINILDSGECANDLEKQCNMVLSGPSICDQAGEYGATIWFVLGAI